MKKLLLASASPRRKAYLEKFFDLCVRPVNVDEKIEKYRSEKEYVVKIAEKKGCRAVELYGDRIPVLAGDTIVTSEGRILEKPVDREHAKKMISFLAGRSHDVISGVFISWKGERRLFSVSTTVIFKELNPEEIEDYISTDEPYDKAGGYGLQGRASSMIKEIRGSYSNVIGLPVCEVFSALRNMNYVKGLFK